MHVVILILIYIAINILHICFVDAFNCKSQYLSLMRDEVNCSLFIVG